MSVTEKQSVELLERAGLEGLSSHHKEEANRLYKGEEKWKMWSDVPPKTCRQPSVVGSTEHLLVGRKHC